MKKNGYFVKEIGLNFFVEPKEIKTLEYFSKLSNGRLIEEINLKLRGTDSFLAIGVLRNTLSNPIVYKDVKKQFHPIIFTAKREGIDIVPESSIVLCEETVATLLRGERSFNKQLYNLFMAEME